jgi:hypothetical protein
VQVANELLSFGGKPNFHIVVVSDRLERFPFSDNSLVTYIPGAQPFCFARNINMGAREFPGLDLIIMNDDAVLLTPYGLNGLMYSARVFVNCFGVVSSGIQGIGCNPIAAASIRQLMSYSETVQHVRHMVPFICTAITRQVWNQAGGLDERYVDYGFDDDDFCRTIRFMLKLKIGVYKKCIVEHGLVPSSYRSKGHCSLEPNKARYIQKWGNHEGP